MKHLEEYAARKKMMSDLSIEILMRLIPMSKRKFGFVRRSEFNNLIAEVQRIVIMLNVESKEDQLQSEAELEVRKANLR